MDKTALHSNAEIIASIFYDAPNKEEIEENLQKAEFTFAKRYPVYDISRYLIRCSIYKKNGKLSDIFEYLKNKYVNIKLNHALTEFAEDYPYPNQHEINSICNKLKTMFKVDLPDDLTVLLQTPPRPVSSGLTLDQILKTDPADLNVEDRRLWWKHQKWDEEYLEWRFGKHYKSRPDIGELLKSMN